jgi:hypothetical protein
MGSFSHKRKLIRKSVLVELTNRTENYGVPVTRAARDLKINMSLPAIQKLIAIFIQMHETNNNSEAIMIKASLFPDWLEDSNDIVKVQPDNYKYVGRFPLGVWVIK